ncbi:MAG: LTA synthase family protein [Clostridia bacterium]|nr:LTA synthase family protein [Clostridia bacterium]
MKKRNLSTVVIYSVSGLLITLGFLALFSAIWFVNNFNAVVDIDAIIFTMFSDMHGVNTNIVDQYLYTAALPTVLCAAACITGIILVPKLIFKYKKSEKKPVSRIYKTVTLSSTIFFCLTIFGICLYHLGFLEYISARTDTTPLFDEQYKNPKTVTVTFPEEKRNLIYIYLESMENTFMDTENGGALEKNTLPALTELAKSNVNFSQTHGIGGAKVTTGSTWTTAAGITQTSGVPMCLPEDIWISGLGEQHQALPGLTSLGDILHDQGYQQALMIGSDISFAGQEMYYKQHKINRIYDVKTAREELLPSKTYDDGFWGCEDFYLYEYAKEKILDLAEGDQPFAFTMFTIDTHHPAGNLCEKCDPTELTELDWTEAENLQFETVLRCADRQINEFILWLQEQDFYENTTVIITGDHCSMNTSYFNEYVSDEYDRRVYNCFINPATTPKQAKNREFTTLDMFPTTLAALGCTIEGDQLGLGVNLFSGKPTLSEIYGFEYLRIEFNKVSLFYEENFYKKQQQ